MKTSSIAVETSRSTTQSDSIVTQTNKRSSYLSYTTMNNKHIFNDIEMLACVAGVRRGREKGSSSAKHDRGIGRGTTHPHDRASRSLSRFALELSSPFSFERRPRRLLKCICSSPCHKFCSTILALLQKERSSVL